MRGDERYWPQGGQQLAPGAVIPPRPAVPPTPPPPASGRGVAQRSTVDVTGATEALVVGPNDVLIVSFPEHMTMDELYAMRDRMRDSDLRPGQILLIAGAEKIVKVEREYLCAACKAPIVKGDRCANCGRGWLVEGRAVVTAQTECGRNQQGHLQCHPERRCGDCPLNTPVSDQEREIAAQRDEGR